MGIFDVATDLYNVFNSERNYKNQVAMQEYEKGLQEKTWEREDNAIGRRMADMKRSGLNPVLAAGNAASTSAPIHVTTPQHDNLKSDANIEGIASTVMNLLKGNQDITKSLAETKRIEAQTDFIGSQKASVQQDIRQKDWNQDLDERLGTPRDKGFILKDLSGLAHMGHNMVDGIIDAIKTKAKGGVLGGQFKKK